MKRFIVAALLAMSACDAVEVPPVGIGGPGGARLMHNAKDVREEYENSFAMMNRYHNGLRLSLRRTPPDTFSAGEELAAIIGKLELMRTCVVEKQRTGIDVYIQEYGRWHKSVSGGNPGGLNDAIDDLERRMRRALRPSEAEYLTEPEPAPTAKPPPSIWMVHAAWKSAHADLESSWAKGPGPAAGAAYRKVKEALAAMEPLMGDGRAQLQAAVLLYDGLARDTRDFSEARAGSDGDLVATELKAIATLVDGFCKTDAPPK